MNIDGLLLTNKAGMNGNQTSIDLIANNIANVNTVGFKAQSGSFQALINNQISPNEVHLASNQPIGLNAGVQVAPAMRDFKAGSLQSTAVPTDFAISGTGFFGVQGANNQLLLTRAGNFHIDAQGELVTTNGLHVATTDTIPQNQWPKGQLQVEPNGLMRIQTAAGSVNVGQLNIYQPTSLAALQATGDNLFQVTPGTNLTPINGTPGAGNINQGFLEASNVDLSSQLTDMITSQRAYQLNAKALQATDAILNTTNNFNQ